MGVVSADDQRFRTRFSELLLEVPTRDLSAGFELARGLGPAVAPVLWTMHGGEKSNARRRMTVLAGAVLAEGTTGDGRCLQALDSDRTQLHDRLVTCLVLALGPSRTREYADFWPRVLGRNQKEPEPLLQVAGLLASARFPGTASSFSPTLLRQGNPGVVAAALFAGAPVPESVTQQFWRRDPPAHSSLVWRGALLGALARHDARPEEDQLLVDQARRLIDQAGEQFTTTREAAALVLGRANAVDPEGRSRPEWRQLQLYASDSRAAARLRPWLWPAPQPLDEDPTRLAVEYVLGRDIGEVLADRAAWSAHRSVRRHVAVALAWRLCAEQVDEPIEWPIAGLPEWFFVRWASGAVVTKDEAIDDPVLDQAATLAAKGRLSRETGRRLLEEALWRWGSHPGLGLWRAQRHLIRDLLLSGSLPGNRYDIGLPDHLRYLPAGLGNENDFFVLAVELYEFLSRSVPPIPDACRLR